MIQENARNPYEHPPLTILPTTAAMLPQIIKQLSQGFQAELAALK
jgi:hypothetical protein